MISIHSDDSDNNYIPRSPAYEPDSPGSNTVQEPEDWDPTPGEQAPVDQQSGPSRTCVFSNIFSASRDSEDNTGAKNTSAGQRSSLGREVLCREFPLFSGV